MSVLLLLGGCANNTGRIAQENRQGENTSPNTTNLADTTVQPTGIALDFSQYDTTPIVWGPGHIIEHARPVDPTKLQERFGEIGGKWLMADDKHTVARGEGGGKEIGVATVGQFQSSAQVGHG